MTGSPWTIFWLMCSCRGIVEGAYVVCVLSICDKWWGLVYWRGSLFWSLPSMVRHRERGGWRVGRYIMGHWAKSNYEGIQFVAWGVS